MPSDADGRKLGFPLVLGVEADKLQFKLKYWTGINHATVKVTFKQNEAIVIWHSTVEIKDGECLVTVVRPPDILPNLNVNLLISAAKLAAGYTDKPGEVGLSYEYRYQFSA